MSHLFSPNKVDNWSDKYVEYDPEPMFDRIWPLEDKKGKRWHQAMHKDKSGCIHYAKGFAMIALKYEFLVVWGQGWRINQQFFDEAVEFLATPPPPGYGNVGADLVAVIGEEKELKSEEVYSFDGLASLFNAEKVGSVLVMSMHGHTATVVKTSKFDWIVMDSHNSSLDENKWASFGIAHNVANFVKFVESHLHGTSAISIVRVQKAKVRVKEPTPEDIEAMFKALK